MSNLVFISGDFSSGSTLLFTLFRKSGGFYSLYEPLHQKLLEYLVFPLKAYEHHFFVGNYFEEYAGFGEVPKLFKPEWGTTRLHIRPDEEAEDLYRYFSYLVGTAFGRAPRVMFKENRLTFRLGWIRANFPTARIIHIQREKESEWRSWVRRVQAYRGTQNVGEDRPTFTAFNFNDWCEELKVIHPELEASNFRTGFERFSAFWELSRAEHLKYADISVDYNDLVNDFDRACAAIGECVGYTFDTSYLRQFVVTPEVQAPLAPKGTDLRSRASQLLYRAGRRYAIVRVGAQDRLRQRLHGQTSRG